MNHDSKKSNDKLKCKQKKEASKLIEQLSPTSLLERLTSLLELHESTPTVDLEDTVEEDCEGDSGESDVAANVVDVERSHGYNDSMNLKNPNFSWNNNDIEVWQSLIENARIGSGLSGHDAVTSIEFASKYTRSISA